MTDLDTTPNYETEKEQEDCDECGQMVDSLAEFKELVVGRRIVAAVKGSATVAETRYGTFRPREATGAIITLDTGSQFIIEGTDDCCAYSDVDDLTLNLPMIDHIITDVRTTNGLTEWHVIADFGEVLKLEIGWSCGNPCYYGYSLAFTALPIEGEVIEDQPALPSAPLAIESGQ